jgi:hypothetical protein
LFKTARKIFSARLRAGEGELLKNYGSALETLLHIRQACNCGQLIPAARFAAVTEVLELLNKKAASATISAEEGKKFFDKLR